MWSNVREYLKRQKGVVMLLAVYTVILTLIFFLYQIPGEAILYGFLLSAVFFIVYGILSFGKFAEKKKSLLEMQKKIGIEVEGLPEPSDAIEEEYQELLRRLYQEKVRQVSKADEAGKDLKEYFTLWAHQIKTPIAAMSLLLQEEDTKEYRELFMELFEIEQYVEMVLQYIRLGSSSSDLVLKYYDLDDCIRQAIRKYARSFIRKKISLDFQETGKKVLTDEKWLVFVLEQLLSNALKYTKTGKISIYQENGKLIIQDTGIGIAPEDLPRIFEKGYTGYNGRKDKKSTGIGLYLCRRILSKLSHEITITSELGKGTKVSLDLYKERLEFD